MIFQLSEESRERISKVLDLGRVALHYGWIPFVIYVGEYDMTQNRADTEPSRNRTDTRTDRILTDHVDLCVKENRFVSLSNQNK